MARWPPIKNRPLPPTSNKNMRFGRLLVCALLKLFVRLNSFCCGAMSLRPRRSRTPRLVAVELGKGGDEVLRWGQRRRRGEQTSAPWPTGPVYIYGVQKRSLSTIKMHISNALGLFVWSKCISPTSQCYHAKISCRFSDRFSYINIRIHNYVCIIQE